MPIRVPQASMAPQLRGRQAGRGQEAREEVSADDRAPEAVRDMMTTWSMAGSADERTTSTDPRAQAYGIDW